MRREQANSKARSSLKAGSLGGEGGEAAELSSVVSSDQFPSHGLCVGFLKGKKCIMGKYSLIFPLLGVSKLHHPILGTCLPTIHMDVAPPWSACSSMLPRWSACFHASSDQTFRSHITSGRSNRDIAMVCRV